MHRVELKQGEIGRWALLEANVSSLMCMSRRNPFDEIIVAGSCKEFTQANNVKSILASFS